MSESAVAQTVGQQCSHTTWYALSSSLAFDSVIITFSYCGGVSVVSCVSILRKLLLGEPKMLILSLARAVERGVGVRSNRRSHLRMGLEHGGWLQVGRKRMTMMRMTSVVCSAQDGAGSRATVMCRWWNCTATIKLQNKSLQIPKFLTLEMRIKRKKNNQKPPPPRHLSIVQIPAIQIRLVVKRLTCGRHGGCVKRMLR